MAEVYGEQELPEVVTAMLKLMTDHDVDPEPLASVLHDLGYGATPMGATLDETELAAALVSVVEQWEARDDLLGDPTTVEDVLGHPIYGGSVVDAGLALAGTYDDNANEVLRTIVARSTRNSFPQQDPGVFVGQHPSIG